MYLEDIIRTVEEDYKNLRNHKWSRLINKNGAELYNYYKSVLYEHDVDMRIQNYARHISEFYNFASKELIGW